MAEMIKKEVGFCLLLGCALLLSCTRLMEAEIATESDTAENQTYTLVVDTDSRTGTRSLGLDASGALKATWAEGEEVKVYKNMDCLGTLTAQSSGKSTTLRGTITGGSIKVGSKLTLEFLSSDYTNQDGTLSGNSTSIDKVCDYAMATVKVTAIDGGTVTTEPASFQNMQAIVRFKFKYGVSSLDVKEMSVTVSGYKETESPSSITISVKPKSPLGEVFVAIPCYYDHELSFSLKVWSGSYYFEKNTASVTLDNGKYYQLTVTF